MIVRKCSMFVVFGICCLLLFAATAIADDITNPILKKLVEKGVLTKQEAVSVMQEMDKDAVEQDKVVEQKIDKRVTEVAPAEGKDLGDVVKAMKGFKFGLLWYLSYMDGQGADVGGKAGDGENHNRFAIKRGYFRVTKTFVPWFDAHMTFDVSQTKDDGSSLDGSVAVRIKYAYGKFNLPDLAFLTKPYFEVGIVHMPWLDFEEHVNFYRLQDTMFTERNKTFNSADFGLTFVSLLGGTMDEEYQNKVKHYYPGRYGSMALGIYNGGGYHASEKNGNKALEGRLTVRPLPDIVPGLQLSYFGIYGKGNTDAEPDWTVNLPYVSFEHEYVTLTGQYYWGKGNQGGADENKKDGYSFFAEVKPTDKLSIIGRYDRFDPNTDADNDENTRYIAGIAYHFYKQHKNMVLLDYDHVDYKDPLKKDDKRIQLTLQVAL
jgi:polyhydroxyalkanoate synthesis regulator phasin